MLSRQLKNFRKYSGRDKQHQGDQQLGNLQIPVGSVPDSPVAHQASAAPDSPAQALSGQEPARGIGEPRGRKRGRPPYTPNESAQRGFIRWFVESPKSIKRIEEAVAKNGGPQRLWMRKFYRDATNAGKGTDLPLKNARMRAQDAQEDRGTEDDGPGTASYDNTSDPQVTSSVSDPLIRYPQSQSTEGQLEEQCNTHKPTTIRWKEPKRTYSLTDANFDYDTALQTSMPSQSSLEFNTVEANPPIETPFSENGDQQRAAKENKRLGKAKLGQQSYLNPSEQPLAFVQSLNQPRKAGRKGTGASDRKPKRRGTTLTLKDAAMDLDDGKKQGYHYRLAKKYTITRRMSQMSIVSLEKFKTANSEFANYHRPTYMNVVPITPSTYPLSANILPMPGQTPPPSQAVVITILTTAWAKGREDRAVRDELERQLPLTKLEREAFVTTSDNLGVSPLHLAVAYGWPHTCRLLLEHGADPNALTNQGTSIYDFAEPAARRGGADMGLYFRILHCRFCIRLGRQPPAPNPNTMASQQEQTQERKAHPASQTRAQPPRGQLHIQTGLNSGRYDDLNTLDDPPVPPFSEHPPWYTADYTSSPTPSVVRKHNSLQFSNEDESPERLSRRRSTVAPYLSSSSYYSEPSFSVVDATEQASSSGNPTLFSDSISPLQETYGKTLSSRQEAGTAYGQGYGNETRRIWSAAPQHPNYPNLHFQTAPLATEQSSSIQQSTTSGSMPMDSSLLPAPATDFSNLGRTSFAPRTLAQPVPNVMSPAAQFTQGGYQPPVRQFAGIQPNTAQGELFRPPASILYGPNASIPQPPQDYWYHPVPPAVSNPMIPRTTTQDLMRPPVPATVPVSAHYSNNPALFEAPLSSAYPARNHHGVFDDAWFCIVGDPGCGRQRICPRCVREYNLV